MRRKKGESAAIHEKDFSIVWDSAVRFVRSKGYGNEIDEFRKIRPPKSADDFLSKYAWVVFASGFNEKILEDKWEAIKKEFLDFSIRKITRVVSKNPRYFETRKMPIDNKRKIAAIIETAKRVDVEDFRNFLDLDKMQDLGYIGEVTKFHLARNLGLDVGKPDRWMIRLSQRLGFPPTPTGVESMFETFHKVTGERVGAIDVVLWRASQLGWKPR